MKYNVEPKSIRSAGVPQPDHEIAAAVCKAIERMAETSRKGIKVRAHCGWVVLDGGVEEWQQRQTIEQAVRKLPGVRGVTNILTVNSRSCPGKRAAEVTR